MKSFLLPFRQKMLFFFLFLFLNLLGIMLSLTNGKVNCFIRLNALHLKWLDVFFMLVTLLGDGWISIVAGVAIILFWRKYHLGIQVFIAYTISGIAAILLKQLFSAPRPMAILHAGEYHYFIAGVTHAGWNSFPSGHTTSIFALVTVLILFFNKSFVSLLLFIVAILVGYSRIYLGQHFLEDVIAGSLLGTTTGLFTCMLTLGKQFSIPGPALKKNAVQERTFFP